ncbi:MAG: AMP-binding protein [Desulfobulbaceae bacterium]|nr:AMP-binding protein [Desulfobulbaceae bacterium]HIJ78139.1 AMP-binding protein [Deltaproteobacteria bacterium]
MQKYAHPTLNRLIDQSAEAYPELPAVGFAFETALTYQEFHQKILLTAAQLKKIGIKKGDRLAILAENSPQWGIAYFAIVRLGAVAVPILPDFTESDVKHIINEAKIKILFTTQKQFEKLYELNLTGLKSVIALDDAPDQNRIITPTPFSKFLAEPLPEQAADNNDDALLTAEDTASIIYTSGTSGHSKAVILTHNNFTNNVRSTEAIFAGESIDNWTFLSILPMSHAYEFTISFLTPLANGCRIVYAGQTPTPTILEKICKTEQPNIMCMVPMVIEKIYKKKILPAINNSIILKTAIKIPLLRKKVLRKIGKNLCNFFGGKLKIAAIGGAPLNIEVEHFLKDAGFPYLVGYGLTEASPLISAGPYGDDIPVGSCGKPILNLEVKIVHPNPKTGVGEVYARGQNIMAGYMNNQEATAETITADGWLATGDLGFIDQAGYLFLKGRSKSVIVLSHGENIYPETIEDKINSFQQVVESLVVECNNRLEARVFLDYDLIDQKTKGKNQQEKLSYINEILADIKKNVNDNLPQYSKISEIMEHQEPFIKTATHKIKRYLYYGAN